MPPDRSALDHGIARGIGALRGAALAWAWVGLVLQRHHLERPGAALAALAVATAVTVSATGLVARRDARVFAAPLVVGELLVGWALLVLDGVVYEAGRGQSLPWAWPAAGIITAAVVGGRRAGLAAAGATAAASLAGESLLRGTADWTASAASKSALYVLAALAAATVTRRLREAEAEISTVRAREEVARTLHDGVLQTLAAIQRRSGDPALSALARDQERDLRGFLFGQSRPAQGLAGALRTAGDAVARRHGVAVQVVLADDLPELGPAAVGALVGAMSEALTNAAKHSGAQRITVYAEPADGPGSVFCSVRDDGCGFEVDVVPAGEGLRRSVRGRMAEVGGTVEVDSRPGRGTEVRMWVS